MHAVAADAAAIDAAAVSTACVCDNSIVRNQLQTAYDCVYDYYDELTTTTLNITAAAAL